MFGSIAKRFFGSSNDRYVTSLHKIVAKINALESQIEALDDAALQAQTPAFRARLDACDTLHDILPDSFPTVCEAAKRTLVMRHLYVQMICGLLLHPSELAEMATGDGHTLMPHIPSILTVLVCNGS